MNVIEHAPSPAVTLEALTLHASWDVQIDRMLTLSIIAILMHALATVNKYAVTSSRAWLSVATTLHELS